MRVFLGIDLPTAVKQSLTSLGRHSVDARWQRGSQLHLTLNFIGEVDDAQLARLRDELHSPPLEPARIRLKGVDVFGSPGKPRALWAGVEPESSLEYWNQVLSYRLEGLGLTQEEVEYKPHVTLARFGRSPHSAKAFLDAHEGYSSEHFTVDEICLFASHLSEEGARYEIVDRFPVGSV